MIVRLTFLAIQVIATLGVVIPLAIHVWLNRYWIKTPYPELESCHDNDLPFLCIVLPVWNEEVIIERKLNNLIEQRYPINRRRFMVVDSASTDGTVEIIKTWMKENEVEVSIIEMVTRLGKSAAVNRAIEELNPEDEIFVMTDAEAILEPGALRRIGRWMRNQNIGAVCGGLDDKSDSTSYRNWYRWFREGESRIDSTPIFEGSIAAYRSSAIGPIRSTSNADDSQLAVRVRESGLRSISDNAICFSEKPITNPKESIARTTRRGQGLSRHFWRHKRHWFRGGDWGKILGLNGLQHTVSPWLIIIGILAGISHALTVILIGWTGSEATLLDRGMLLIDALVIFSLGIGVTGIRVPLCGTILAYLQNNLYLAYGMVLLKAGKSLHQWDSIKSNRIDI
ncbi:MAG: glycosyltransferase [Candidatus Thalassarchaeaceae archaeon]|jgi:cellulose synthase/poly-beta-1,6-N-acetylglucosamine synthase-like glycosyltransferase|nr:glycosyltransferase [Candidatus Thalassarchaeaceae archaeon]